MAHNEFMVSYGSLLSRHSRTHYSGASEHADPVVVSGWRRAWATRYPDEGATYASACRQLGSRLHAVLIPTRVTDELRQRERFYQLTEVDPVMIEPLGGQARPLAAQSRFWICEALQEHRADRRHPLPQTYVDTCVLGCFETGLPEFADEFVIETSGWEGEWVNDRHTSPLYPRRAPLRDGDAVRIDALLEQAGALKHRSE